MTTKAIWVLMFLAVGYIGYLLFQQWETVQLERETGKKAEAAAQVVGESLAGLPQHLDHSLKVAKERGPAAFRTWFNENEKKIADPRKAWLELELCVAMSRQNPSEAKKIFAGVKSRVPPSSPAWPRMKELEKTFE
jgi:hypothetical protein